MWGISGERFHILGGNQQLPLAMADALLIGAVKLHWRLTPEGPYTTSAYAHRFLSHLETIWPGISPHYTGTATLSYPTGYPSLLGSYACFLVGQYTSIAGYEKVRQGNIHFAGEHGAITFQGYMEGGAREGKRAAQEILKDYA